MHRDDNFATFICPLSRNSSSLDLLKPSGDVHVCTGRALPLISSECSVSRPRVYLLFVMQTEDPGDGASGVCCHGIQRAIIRIQDKKYKAIHNALSGVFCYFKCCPEIENTSV